MQGQYRGDFTRDTFDPFKHFTRVLMQQGRVQLEADWNEQAAILLHYLQALAADLIGQHGCVARDSFKIAPMQITPAPSPPDFSIGAGHYYVDGILCELEATRIPVIVQTQPTKVQVLTVLVDDLEFQPGQYVEVYPPSPTPPALAKISDVDPAKRTLTLDRSLAFTADTPPMIRRLTTYRTQPDYPVPDALDNKTYQVYLDVWERHVTYVEDDSIREVALGGPDTATRAKVVWQVKVTDPFTGGCASVQDLTQKFQPDNRGRLKAKAKEKSTSTDPCIIPPDSKYRGAENQLYRVEIHNGGTAGTATFKWSRENGSVVFPILSLVPGTPAGTTKVTLENLGRDDRFGLTEGDWVEVVDDDYVLRNRAEPLLQINSIDRTAMTVTLNGVPGSDVGQNQAKHPLLRRWDQKEIQNITLQDGAVQLKDADTWLDLEDGIQIYFEEGETTYRSGDYWLVPARTATGDIEWPIARDSQGNPVLDSQGKKIQIALPPHGVQHHYAPLVIITVVNGVVQSIGAANDCRNVRP